MGFGAARLPHLPGRGAQFGGQSGGAEGGAGVGGEQRQHHARLPHALVG